MREAATHAALVDLPHARRDDGAGWRTLTAAAPPFLGPDFFALAARFADGAPVVAEARAAAELIGVLPLVRRGDRLAGLRCDFSPGYDYVGAPDGVDAIWHALHADRSWTELELAKVPADSPLVTRLPALAAADGCPSVLRVDARHPYFSLRGFEAAMSPKFRSNLQRCARKAGGVELERVAVPDRAAFDEALAIEAMAWKGAAGTSIASDPRAAHLYRAFTRLCGRRGRGAIYFLRAGGRRIAMLIAIEDGHSLFALKIGFDPSAANLSPGHLLVWKVAADAEARGLVELDLVGRDDEWKRKWTDRTHEHVGITIYRDSARGLARYARRHLLSPRLPARWRGGVREIVPRGCQRGDLIGAHTLVDRVRGRLDRGLGVRSGIRRALRGTFVEKLGEASAFERGAWVRVKPAAELQTLLDDRARTRGLEFTASQWSTAGRVFRIDRQVRRLRDDRGRFRAIDRTVLLDGVDCSGGGEREGCGRHCPMMYRDEWLEPATAPDASAPAIAPAVRHARVRSAEEIRAGLDLRGRRDGLTFMPEMEQYAGKRFAIANVITTVFEHDAWVATRAPVYVLDGLHCGGAVVGDRGPCDRACSLLWHEAWLVVEPDAR